MTIEDRRGAAYHEAGHFLRLASSIAKRGDCSPKPMPSLAGKHRISAP